jgi:kinetochore protein Nuf2
MFTDMTKPTHDRVVKIFSYLINFVRFRESQTAAIDEHFNKSEKTKARIETLYAENQEMEQRLEEMKQNQRSVEGQVKEKTRRNDELKARLLELRRGQERVAESLERAKADKAKTQTTLEEKTEKLLKTRQENEKLRPYVLQSPATLQSSLTELSENLMRDKGQIDSMEKRMRALQTSVDTFNTVTNDIQSCLKVLEEISSELQKEEEEDAKASRNRDALAERGNNVREVERTEKLVQRQLTRLVERTEALRKTSREKAEIAQARMEELRDVQRQLREERGEKQREMERRRIRIEQTEKKVIPTTPHNICDVLSNGSLDGRFKRKHRKRSLQRA